ncbi:NAD(+) kinase [Buchnera aphidicola]|uniref:NAD kinase n=1 Tax=Buchnera aphidicola str. USDA (Myzus persicae) TaxID=1009856 RepID=W0P435_BUCMP|nr:NAD(+) kinase [Buchnera aphidicola]AHG60187.1 Ppnk [Buchnera aphidicola str. USDA (Myzus persicae)]AHG60766.1 Ppnk [Buchnera aphidicola str. W106 (Myzus persicae)]AHG61338.1 Ppnk [Buchnera aphidicola str. G002 (Myzus persicae)]AHG61911.1 Ppnk [Buchnera aphidicola str. F009 (Myzus persicae)]WAI03123.1 MAG: NAD(+) kinase [Buchnera aphidicola (Myzus persicae)]
MKQHFTCIGIVGHPRHASALITHKILYKWLINNGYKVFIERTISKELKLDSANTATLIEIGQSCDLAVVIGGDGNLLCAARVLSFYDIKIIGINRGNLGFLTDLNPDTGLQKLSEVLSGKYLLENRFLLDAQVCQEKTISSSSIAINEVVLHTKHLAHMIEFEVYINDKFSFAQRADGLIVSTPTGSTGYSLSAGGPIIATSLDAIVLVPMFPHTLSARPLVIDSDSIICLKFSNIEKNLKISCDSQIILNIKKDECVFIRRSHNHLNLIHPRSYDYFKTLTSKLNWSKKFF